MNGWIDGREERWWDEEREGDFKKQDCKYYLKIICNKAVDNRIHTAIQTTEGDSQVVYYHMMRHFRVEIHHDLQHTKSSHIILLHLIKTLSFMNLL